MQVRFLVLDEADKLFDMGFVEQIDAVLHACSHKEIVRALFSATLPEKVEELARCGCACCLPAVASSCALLHVGSEHTRHEHDGQMMSFSYDFP